MITCTFEKGYQDNLRHAVVHAIAEKDGCILLAKRSGNILESGKWNIPGGFMKRDETASEAALRELYEETGWRGEIISLFRINSKPVRPGEDRQNVVFEFLVRPICKSGEPDGESSHVEWVPFDRLLPFGEYAFDHGESLEIYLRYRKERFTLPIID